MSSAAEAETGRLPAGEGGGKGWRYKGYWVLYRSTLLCLESLADNWHVLAHFNLTQRRHNIQHLFNPSNAEATIVQGSKRVAV